MTDTVLLRKVGAAFLVTIIALCALGAFFGVSEASSDVMASNDDLPIIKIKDGNPDGDLPSTCDWEGGEKLTLTLNGGEYQYIECSNTKANLGSDAPLLTIIVNGDCKINAPDGYYCIHMTHYSLKVTGDGSLTMNSREKCIIGFDDVIFDGLKSLDIVSAFPINVSDGDIKLLNCKSAKIEGSGSPSIASDHGSVTIDNSYVEMINSRDSEQLLISSEKGIKVTDGKVDANIKCYDKDATEPSPYNENTVMMKAAPGTYTFGEKSDDGNSNNNFIVFLVIAIVVIVCLLIAMIKFGIIKLGKN